MASLLAPGPRCYVWHYLSRNRRYALGWVSFVWLKSARVETGAVSSEYNDITCFIDNHGPVLFRCGTDTSFEIHLHILTDNSHRTTVASCLPHFLQFPWITNFKKQHGGYFHSLFINMICNLPIWSIQTKTQRFYNWLRPCWASNRIHSNK